MSKMGISSRMAVVEKAILVLGDGMNDLKKELLELKNNHLAHITEDITDIKIKVNSNPTWLVTFIITALTSIATGLIVKITFGG